MTAEPRSPAAAGSRARDLLTRGRRVPTFSGKASAFILLGCLGASAALFPLVMRQPVWVEMEAVLAAWWVIWTLALAWMLHDGRAVADDHRWTTPDRVKLSKVPLDVFMPGEGCLEFLAGLALLLLAWQVLELVVPLVGLAGYAVVRRMVARVINDGHHCKGQGALSLSWGALWATLYTAPLAGLVYAVHRLLMARH